MAPPRNGQATGLAVPAPTSRPGSASFADVYGGLDFGTPTSRQGSNGAAATTPVSAPIGSPEFFRQPAGILIVLIAIIAAWSYVDR